jgi:hypothetical protein
MSHAVCDDSVGWDYQLGMFSQTLNPSLVLSARFDNIPYCQICNPGEMQRVPYTRTPIAIR